jgi:biotin carboxylase
VISPDGPRVLEVAARLGSDHDAALVEAAVGVDLNELALGAALGEDADERALRPQPRAGGACTRFFLAPPGIVAAVAVDGARAAEGVVDVLVHHGPGTVVAPLRRAADRAGAVIAVGDSAAGAERHAEHAAALVRFDTADAGLLV